MLHPNTEVDIELTTARTLFIKALTEKSAENSIAKEKIFFNNLLHRILFRGVCATKPSPFCNKGGVILI